LGEPSDLETYSIMEEKIFPELKSNGINYFEFSIDIFSIHLKIELS